MRLDASRSSDELPGLGVVELTVAIHYVFNTPDDKLIWDVGHQCYPHKIVTGRRDRIRTLRQGGGLSRFTKRAENEYLPFGAGPRVCIGRNLATWEGIVFLAMIAGGAGLDRADSGPVLPLPGISLRPGREFHLKG